MYTRNHAILSAIVGVPVAMGGTDIQTQVLIWVYFVLLGTVIDFDHFVIARFNSGNWRHLIESIRNPSQLFFDQTAIFEPGDLYRDQRLFTHHIILGFVTVITWFISPFLTFASAVAIYIHILADLYADMKTRRQYIENINEYFECIVK